MPEFWTLKNQDRMKKEKRWCGSYELGQSDDEMERQSKVGGLQRLEKLCEDG